MGSFGGGGGVGSFGGGGVGSLGGSGEGLGVGVKGTSSSSDIGGVGSCTHNKIHI